jgi:DNA polymerase (family 10)
LTRWWRREEDLTRFPGIGEAIASAIREIVTTGMLAKLERLRSEATPAVAELSAHPRLDPKRVMRVYKKLGISSLGELNQRVDSGEIENMLGSRMAQHIRQGLTDTHAMLVFVIETDDFPQVIERMQRYGGRTPLVHSSADHASFALSSGILLRLQLTTNKDWGFHMVACTGSKKYLKKLTAATTAPLREMRSQGFTSEKALYCHFGLQYIEPELREGHDEVERAKAGTLPRLVTAKDIRGELHAHSRSSDGGDSIEGMADSARERGYEYIGITDHSQRLKIAGGVSVDDLWQQIRFIDKLNGRLRGFLILKSSEVDILADGSLDYPAELLKELDYTVCSIHSRFALDKKAQTERLLRAMDNPYFNILGHATGRLLLKRPGYEIDVERVIKHARQNGCFFEINSSPDRLDLSADNARRAAAAGVMIAVSTDSHSIGELDLVRCGLDQARRAGLEKSDILNSQPWNKLRRLFRR